MDYLCDDVSAHDGGAHNEDGQHLNDQNSCADEYGSCVIARPHANANTTLTLALQVEMRSKREQESVGAFWAICQTV